MRSMMRYTTCIAIAIAASMGSGCADPKAKTSSSTIAPQTYYASANLMASRQEYQEAVRQYRLAIEGDPKLTRAYNRLGICHHQLDELHQAEAAFAQALKKEPQSAVLQNNLGFTFLRERRFDEAEKKFRQALELSPGFAKARMNLAISLARRDRIEEALTEFGRVVPTEIAYYNVAVIRLEERDYQAAAWALGKSLEHNPNFGPASESIEQVRYAASQQASRRSRLKPFMPSALASGNGSASNRPVAGKSKNTSPAPTNFDAPTMADNDQPSASAVASSQVEDNNGVDGDESDENWTSESADTTGFDDDEAAFEQDNAPEFDDDAQDDNDPSNVDEPTDSDGDDEVGDDEVDIDDAKDDDAPADIAEDSNPNEWNDGHDGDMNGDSPTWNDESTDGANGSDEVNFDDVDPFSVNAENGATNAYQPVAVYPWPMSLHDTFNASLAPFSPSSDMTVSASQFDCDDPFELVRGSDAGWSEPLPPLAGRLADE